MSERGLKFEDKHLTQQHFKDRTDINCIMSDVLRGVGSPVAKRLNPTYGEFHNAGDFQECCQKIKDAEEEWNQMPAKIKVRFNQDPGKLIEFLEDEKNREEAIELGLIERPVEIDVEPPKKVGEKIEKPEKIEKLKKILKKGPEENTDT